MKIVIDIDENVFTRLFDNGTEDYQIVNDDLFAIAKAIRGGTPLPEGHGNLIGLDALHDAMYHMAFETADDEDARWQSGLWVRYRAVESVLKEQPIIIEADKEGGKE